MKTPKQNQRLYRYARWNGHKPGMEIVRFVEQSVSEGASAETWLVQEVKVTTGDTLHRVRCSIDSYFRSKAAAYAADLASLREGKRSIRQQRAELLQRYHETESEIRRVQAEMKEAKERDELALALEIARG